MTDPQMQTTDDRMIIGKTIKMPAMRRGLCGYENETVLVAQKTLEEMAKTSYGIPVIIEHPDTGTTPENPVGERAIIGRVADMHYDSETDLWLAHFVVDSQQAVDLLKKGWGVSTAYAITEYGPGGTLNNVPYDREVKEARYLHLAIVRQPRYEMARDPVFYNSVKKGLNIAPEVGTIDVISSKTHGSKNMIGKLFRLLRQEVKINEGEEICIEIDGKQMSLNEVAEALKKAEGESEAAKKNTDEDSKKVLKGEDEVEINGERMTVNELSKRYQAMVKKSEGEAEDKANKKNTDEGEAACHESEGEAKKNEESPSDKPTKEEEEEKAKVNSRHTEMSSIAENAAPIPVVPEQLSLRERMELGRKRYGSGC